MTVVLDANILIAALQPDHMHHHAVLTRLDRLPPDPEGKIAVVHRLTMAEVLVGYDDPIDQSVLYKNLVEYGGLRIAQMQPDGEISLLVRARQKTGVKMPDACVLATAIAFNVSVMTFDKKLAKAAEQAGVNAFPLNTFH